MTALPPIEDAISALDTPDAIAGRHQRAVDWAKRAVGDERAQLINRAGRPSLEQALAPRRADPWTAAHRSEIDRLVTSNVDALVVQQCEQILRRMDEQALYEDPDRQEEQRIWSTYTSTVSRLAWSQGALGDDFVARWRKLMAERQLAEQFGESTTDVDRRLEAMGTPHPVLPDAAWETADALSEPERAAELDRLKSKYGPRHQKSPAPSRRKAR